MGTCSLCGQPLGNTSGHVCAPAPATRQETTAIRLTQLSRWMRGEHLHRCQLFQHTGPHECDCYHEEVSRGLLDAARIVEDRDTLRAELARVRAEQQAEIERLTHENSYHAKRWGTCVICALPVIGAQGYICDEGDANMKHLHCWQRQRAEQAEATVASYDALLRDLVRSASAQRQLSAGFKGIGHNILAESAGRLTGDLRRA